jgi:DNA-binding MarR family transcriptional regulator|tara:strand:+ start:1764 stop:2894 length:1131 start_codon:yes stop_codon:yes gene_type:complete
MARTIPFLFIMAILLSVASFNVSAEGEDSDEDGWSDYHEESCGTDPQNSLSVPEDTDSSGICDSLDPDDDNDGWWDNIELLCGSDQLDAGSVPNDLDGDGTCDILDKDTDEDGWSDLDEILCQSSPINNSSVPLDIDGDGRCELLPIPLPTTHEPIHQGVVLQPSTIRIAAGGSAAVLVTGVIYSVEPIRWTVSKKTWLSFLLLIGTVRKTRDGEFTRGRLYGFIESNPGIHLSALTRLSNLGNNQATYHLDRLEKESRIWSRRDGRLLIFFADSMPSNTTYSSQLLDINFSKNSIKSSILMHLNQAELMNLAGPSGANLAEEIGVSSQVLSYHVRSLIDWKMVERKRSLLKVSLSITELGIEALTGIGHERMPTS